MSRDHLFISYAWEDGALAEWLTLKLTALGYRVWCDRIKLLGGESYPRDIDDAIKTGTFRVLALLSHHSIQKPNPLKERTLALNLARERREDFLIPLNVDGLPPTSLDWMLSDLSYIPFTSWSDGLSALLKKLEAVSAPRENPDGAAAVHSWLDAGLNVTDRPERLWTNLIPIQLPAITRRITLRVEGGGDWPADLPRYQQSERVAWSFAEPPSMRFTNVEQMLWSGERRRFDGMSLADIVARLVQEHLDAHCRSRGLRRASNGDWFFPGALVPSDVLRFTTYTGRSTRTKVVGERKFWSGPRPERCRYHLSFTLRPRLFGFGRPMILLRPRVVLTELSGEQMDATKLVRRRKALCKSWFNHHWLSRVLAVSSFLGGGATESVKLAPEWCPDLTIESQPLTVESPVSLAGGIAVEEPDGLEDEGDLVEDAVAEDEDDTEGAIP